MDGWAPASARSPWPRDQSVKLRPISSNSPLDGGRGPGNTPSGNWAAECARAGAARTKYQLDGNKIQPASTVKQKNHRQFTGPVVIRT